MASQDRGVSVAPVDSPVPSSALRPVAVRPALVRPRDGRVVAGVAGGVAAHLGLPVRAVRLAFALTAISGGFGLVMYVWLWALVPTNDDPAAGGAAPAGPPAQDRPAPRRPSSTRLGDVVVGGLLLAGGLVVLGGQIGWQVPLGALLPLIVVLGGAALVYTQLDEVQGSRWASGGARGRMTALRVAAGVVLVLGGVSLAVVGSTDVAYAGRVLVAVAAMLGGALLVLAPWGIRLWRDLSTEREARAREAERADIAAHLHDSVLQTLALIQRSSDDAAQVVRLARAQERDLRSWLYGGGASAAGTLEGRIRAAAEDVEDLHGVAVDVVVVGDRPLDDRGEAMVAALREAMVNAVRHAGAPVMVYVETGPDAVEAFVRDRGPGFDLGSVPGDRHGVRESIIARMQRHGGTAVVRSLPGEGTEVRLALPDAATPTGDAVAEDVEEDS